MNLLDMLKLAKEKNLSQYTLALYIYANLKELKDDPVIRATIQKVKELRKLKKSLSPEDYYLLFNALSSLELMLVLVDGEDEG